MTRPAHGRPSIDPKLELKRLLREATELRGWSKADLAKRSGLNRNVVGAALDDDKGVPSTATLGSLCRVLSPDPSDLLVALVRLREQASAKPRPAAGHLDTDLPVPAWPVTAWSPYMLGVHQAVSAGVEGSSELTAFVPRQHDHRMSKVLRNAVQQQRHALVILVGGSSTGKTRSAMEAVRTGLPDRPLAAPVDTASLLATLRKWPVEQPVVLWLNEMQRFLQGTAGAEAALELRRRLTMPGCTVVLGTLWPSYYDRLLAITEEASEADVNARELLNSAEIVLVPETFQDPVEWKALREAARHDTRLAMAVQATDGRVIQALSGGPALVDRYERVLDPHCRAIVSAAMDAHWLDVTGQLPAPYLEVAAAAYLTARQRVAEKTWFVESIHQATAEVNGVAALTPTRAAPGIGPADGYILADYLAQHGRAVRAGGPVPAEVSQALIDHVVAPADRWDLARKAERQGSFRFAEQLLLAEAQTTSDGGVLYDLGKLQERRGDLVGAEKWLRAAHEAGTLLARTDLIGLLERSGRLEDGLDLLRSDAADGDRSATLELGGVLRHQGRIDEAERLLRALVDHGNLALAHPPSIDLVWTGAMYELALLLERTGRADEADSMLRTAAREGSSDAVRLLDERHPESAAQRLKDNLLAAAEAGDRNAMRSLQWGLAEAGDKEGAAYWLRRGAAAGDLEAMVWLAQDLRRERRFPEAREWLRRSVESWGHPYPRCMVSLLESPPRPPDWRIESHCSSTATHALEELGEIMEEEGDLDEAERLWDAMDKFGSRGVLKRRCLLLARRGEQGKAEQLLRDRIEDGGTGDFHRLADFLIARGRPAEAEAPLREAAHKGNGHALTRLIDLLYSLGRGDEGDELKRHGL
ncbi:helix-turn-helix domain-containing protein [Couchioplanes caeruleus]|uniref:HTH cro/C1-type domain-containing protein n=2 Tax=Couchioplanes caeruleus TaxID=56438 RepID=A0A1K0G6N1_9ACTN|nr:helix-turn-helix domain-containing protein [Couchioplanes caeruleus]OJF12922.1 hypothetical protein BG844_18015 [Couchioplanes caeruleus subsp. caeruleus]ROP33869.1 Cro/C1-type helix-turn-helix DNA-binding protein [Couchioplanes caeruleus]